MTAAREVVVTGMGVVSPIGVGIAAHWSSISNGFSGITRFEPFATQDVPFHLCAKVTNFDGKDYVQPRKAIKVMCREIQMAYGAAAMATNQAGLKPGVCDPDRFGVVFGSEMFYGEIDELAPSFRRCESTSDPTIHSWGVHAMHELFPLWMLKYLPNMAACHVGIAHDARGPNNTLVNGEASGVLALIEAADAIRRDLIDIAIVGGCGSRLSLAGMVFRGQKDLSRWSGDPKEAIKPFDAKRDGGVLGEGAGVLVLESREHARIRNATVLARVSAYSSRFERALTGAPSGRAIRQTIDATWATANRSTSQLGFVSASAGGYILNDRIEAQAIRASLGDVPVVAPRSYFGALGAGSSAVEMVTALAALTHDSTPATLNHRNADPECPVRVAEPLPLTAEKKSALVVSHSYTGHAASVLFEGELS